MAKQQRNALRAGVFILTSIAVALAVVVGIKGLSHFTESLQVRTVRFALGDDIGGLRIGDEVRAGGFKIGEVRSIDIVGADVAADAPAGIVITYAIPRRYAVRAGAVLGIQGTLTGVSWLNFENFGAGPSLPEGQPLAGRPSPMHQVFAALQQIAPDARDAVAEAKGILRDVHERTVPAVNEVVRKAGDTADAFTRAGRTADGLVGDVRGRVPEVVKKYAEVMDKAGDMMVKAGNFFGETTTDFRTAMKNIATAMGTVNQKLPGILEGVDGAMKKINTTLEGAQVALGDVKSTVANAREMSGSVKTVLLGNEGKLDAMITSLKTASDNLKHATAEIRHSPWRLLYKPQPNEMANLNLFDAAREFAEGASSVNDASMALRDSLKNRALAPAEVGKLVDRLDQSMEKFRAVEQKLWASVKE